MVAAGVVVPLLFNDDKIICLNVPFSSTICWIMWPGGTCFEKQQTDNNKALLVESSISISVYQTKRK